MLMVVMPDSSLVTGLSYPIMITFLNESCLERFKLSLPLSSASPIGASSIGFGLTERLFNLCCCSPL